MLPSDCFPVTGLPEPSLFKPLKYSVSLFCCREGRPQMIWPDGHPGSGVSCGTSYSHENVTVGDFGQVGRIRFRYCKPSPKCPGHAVFPQAVRTAADV